MKRPKKEKDVSKLSLPTRMLVELLSEVTDDSTAESTDWVRTHHCLSDGATQMRRLRASS